MKLGKSKGKIKIFLILSDCIGGYGGIAEYNRNLLNAIAQNENFFIYCFVRIGSKSKYVSNNYVQYKPVKNKFVFSFIVILKAIFLRPKIVFNGHLFLTYLSYIVSKISNSIIVSQFHGTEIWDKSLDYFKVKILEKSHCLSVSNYTKKNLYKTNGIKSTVIPNTFNKQFIYLDKKQKLRDELKINHDDIVLISVGRLDSRNDGYKGQEHVIDFIYNNKLKSDKNYKYLIIGKGDYKETLLRKVKNLNLEKEVSVLGYVSTKNLIKYYNCSDIFIMLSKGEGFGIVYLEAMSCGLPTIGFDFGGVKDVLVYPFSKRIKSKFDLKSAIEDLEHGYKFNSNNISKIIDKDFGFSVFSKKLNEFFLSLDKY